MWSTTVGESNSMTMSSCQPSPATRLVYTVSHFSEYDNTPFVDYFDIRFDSEKIVSVLWNGVVVLQSFGWNCDGSVVNHYNDVIMGPTASQITSLTIVYSTVYLGADQRKHQSPALLAFVRGIHRGPENSPHKWPVTRKMFPFDDVIMCNYSPSITHPRWAWFT